jgi:hypothetical protein
MNANKFDSFIKIKIQALVDCIMQEKQLPFEEALGYLYGSRTYHALISEPTKLWHFSTNKLFQILNDEYKNNQISFPDYA